MQTLRSVPQFVLKGFKDNRRSIFGTHKTLDRLRMQTRFSAKPNLCVGTSKDEVLSYILAAVGQSVLPNFGTWGFPLYKFVIHHLSEDRKLRIRPVNVRNLPYLFKYNL